MAHAFKAGDLAQVKSGGPIMTVEDVGELMTGRAAVWCVWFDGKKQVRDTFAPEALQVVAEEDLPKARIITPRSPLA